MKNIWFTSDLHLGHKNIIFSCNRPFSSIEEMDESLIQNYNNVVGENDVVFILGDFSLTNNNEKLNYYFHRLNAKKYLIKGNHDQKNVLKLPWEWVKDVYFLKLKSFIQGSKQEMFLSHYPHRSWPKSYHNVPHLHGHCHNNLEPYGKSFDVGVDCWDYKPVHLDVVLKKVEDLANNEI